MTNTVPPLPITYTLSFVNALSTGGTIAPSFFASDATVAFSKASITVPAHGEAELHRDDHAAQLDRRSASTAATSC